MNRVKFNFTRSNYKFGSWNINKDYCTLSANFIRKTFIDYFLNENHSYIKSSPVRPFNDPSLEFVNAGMNQFKNVFLGYEVIPAYRAVNSQKCVRIGGKHNDLNSVGMDTYHHTFFEMLGNWSFNDYFKKEACKLAWDLITSKPYALDTKRLYVTYFKGDETLKLPPDLETKEIWEEIGVPKDRIIPFGLKENFWEMGLTGPCGPCTEIHYDHLGTVSRPHLVNKDSPDLTELWNNVFIQFNRLEDGSLAPLDKHFVDTGMGLERLVALLQGKCSNYDTDIFIPYFEAISKLSGFMKYSGKFGKDDENGIDTAYRILADHSRMVSISIADNIFPEESHGLRRVIRKGLIMSEKFLPGNGASLMVELSKVAAETFSQVFPEVSNNLRQIEFVLRDENELWEEVKSKVRADWKNVLKNNPHLESLSDVQSSGLISSYKEIKKRKIPMNSLLPEDLCLIMYDRYGLNPRVIEELARVCGYSVDISKLEKDILALREKNKLLIYSTHHIDLPRATAEYVTKHFHPTDDSLKAKYFRDSKDEYCFEKLRSNILTLVINGLCIKNISSAINQEDHVGVLLDKTNFWSSLKGSGDCGEIELHDGENNKIGKLNVERVVNLGGYVYHIGKMNVTSECPSIPVNNLTAEISINYKTRLDLMRNTSAAHLLSLALQEKFICNMQSCKITNQEFSADFLIYGHKFDDTDVKLIEERVNSLINEQFDIDITKKSTDDLVGAGDLYLPPYISPNMKLIHIVSVNLKEGKSLFREVTVGPNVLNTKDIGEVCFFNFETKNRGRSLKISGLSGEKVAVAIRDAKAAMLYLKNEEMDAKIKLAKLNCFMMENPIPLELKDEFLSKMQLVKSQVKQRKKNSRMGFIEKFIQEAKGKGKEYVVLYVGQETKLEKLVQLSSELPIMLFACNGSYFSARCHVPKGLSALRPGDWMKNVAEKLGSECLDSKVQDSSVYFMRPIKIDRNELKNMVELAEKFAKKEADSLLSSKGSQS